MNVQRIQERPQISPGRSCPAGFGFTETEPVPGDDPVLVGRN